MYYIILFKYLFKDYFVDIYVDCFYACPDQQCASSCAREFNENVLQEKSNSYFMNLIKI